MCQHVPPCSTWAFQSQLASTSNLSLGAAHCDVGTVESVEYLLNPAAPVFVPSTVGPIAHDLSLVAVGLAAWSPGSGDRPLNPQALEFIPRSHGSSSLNPNAAPFVSILVRSCEDSVNPLLGIKPWADSAYDPSSEVMLPDVNACVQNVGEEVVLMNLVDEVVDKGDTVGGAQGSVNPVDPLSSDNLGPLVETGALCDDTDLGLSYGAVVDQGASDGHGHVVPQICEIPVLDIDGLCHCASSDGVHPPALTPPPWKSLPTM